MKKITSSQLIILVAIFLITADNVTFFSKITEVYPVNLKNLAFLGSLVLVFGSIPVLLFSLVCYKHTIKPVLIIILLASSFAGYFMDSYNVIVDNVMIQNIVNTDRAEALDLISLKLILYVTFLGIIPSLFVYNVKIAYENRVREVVSRVKLFSLTLVTVISVVLIFGSFYASFFREHKPLRYYANPSSYLYAAAKYVHATSKKDSLPLKQVGTDAKIPPTDMGRELIIFVVGETARADRFSLNGYKRETNPLLKKEAVISFSNFWACGTSTATSVPCMFSIYKESEYSDAKAQGTENLVDVLRHAGVTVLWLDNNSDSHGVALRVPYINYKIPENNPICDVECRDEGMLSHLQKYIDEHRNGDLFIVLHQMGNHGPAYYKRYPPAFEKFLPACRTNQLEDCTMDEIDNAYDNAILYTDYFLSRVIRLLKKNSAKFESAMFYVSDHGESLGENGVYLHGMPTFIAPDAQRRIPAIMWFGKNFSEATVSSLIKKKDKKYTHNNVFHTILGFMEIESSVYEKDLDIVQSAR